ncbi:hypothetical protein [Bdellovibrio sp. HCB274]|uniref:hypothetical protein n=1 Tax=Bdellovibrio sp. HCB274 TaxID=3394361 RepID=UPI0039B3E025
MEVAEEKELLIKILSINLTWSFSMLDDAGPFGWHRCDEISLESGAKDKEPTIKVGKSAKSIRFLGLTKYGV